MMVRISLILSLLFTSLIPVDSQVVASIPDAPLYRSLVQQRHQLNALTQETEQMRKAYKELEKSHRQWIGEVKQQTETIAQLEKEIQQAGQEKETLEMSHRSLNSHLPLLQESLGQYDAAIREFIQRWFLLVHRKKGAYIYLQPDRRFSFQKLNLYVKYYFSSLLISRKEQEKEWIALRQEEARLKEKKEKLSRKEAELRETREVSTAELKKKNEFVRELGAKKREMKKKLEALAAADQQVRSAMDQLERELKEGDPFLKFKGKLPHPVNGIILSHAEVSRKLNLSDTLFKSGILYGTEVGTDVKAISQGQVVFAGEMEPYRKVVIMDHGGGYFSVTAFLRDFRVKQGAVAVQGEKLGVSSDVTYCELRFHLDTLNAKEWFRAGM
ncbi:MAG: peptidoglycan DD-metalloendopeptidase family protein [Deltaproteobacteria bacterium]|nr:peptidoglycan DD-metalloendopeptidase family protein [Deltaproteobacteria bacterium]